MCADVGFIVFQQNCMRLELRYENEVNVFDVVAYHSNCPDGFCAAYIVARKYPEVTLVPVTYGQSVDDELFRDKRVIVVDFSWSREETIRLHNLSKLMQILDHHQTAELALKDLAYCTFDMTRSGAQLAWDYIHPTTDRPWYVEYVADRDLWRWALPDSKIVNAFIMALPHTIQAWSVLDTMTFGDALLLGRGACMHVDHYIEKVCAQAYPGVHRGLKLSIVNAPYLNISDVANRLCEQGADVGVGWFVRGDGLMQFGLRSLGDLDVSLIAKSYGGGGHRNASGFQVPFAEGLTILASWTLHQSPLIRVEVV